ncbi:MAG: methyltransferase domain-containing protein [Proteobacteria bacterium]|nr:methyltransferase domain-containing protein [Pseudomonadota bacterium]
MKHTAYSAKYIPNSQEIVISGSLRPQGKSDLEVLYAAFSEALADDTSGGLYFNLKRLRQLNHTGFVHLTRMVRQLAMARSDLNIKLVVSKLIPWAGSRFEHLASLWDTVELQQHERASYPAQGVIDTDGLIPLVRTQNALLWNVEKRRLPEFGLCPGMRVADICCGIGDFAVYVRKMLEPEMVIGIDHSRRFLDLAARFRDELQLDRIEYRYGDATHLLVPDNSFDFVTCRQSLQIFDRPEQIIHELYRICKPGGRVYVTNEFMSHNTGYPHQDSIHSAYGTWSRMFGDLGMDVEFGPKAAVYLKDEGFDEVRLEVADINNTNSDLDDFVQVIEAWIDYAVDVMAPALHSAPAEIEEVRSGLRDFIGAIRNRRGFASWPIYMAVARKPMI